VIDVGEAWQLEVRGTILGARNITRGELDVRADTQEARKDPALQDRMQTILLICGGGGKATLSAATLLEMGFTDVFALKGGCKAWQAAGFPLVNLGPRLQADSTSALLRAERCQREIVKATAAPRAITTPPTTFPYGGSEWPI
jgi:rhodanese-related sulfurtransferase